MKQQRLSYSGDSQSALAHLLGRTLTVAVTVVALTAAFMFSLIFFAIALAVGLLIGGRLWWKTRALRKALRENPIPVFRSPEGGRVIEGEAVVVDRVVADVAGREDGR